MLDSGEARPHRLRRQMTRPCCCAYCKYGFDSATYMSMRRQLPIPNFRMYIRVAFHSNGRCRGWRGLRWWPICWKLNKRQCILYTRQHSTNRLVRSVTWVYEHWTVRKYWEIFACDNDCYPSATNKSSGRGKVTGEVLDDFMLSYMCFYYSYKFRILRVQLVKMCLDFFELGESFWFCSSILFGFWLYILYRNK